MVRCEKNCLLIFLLLLKKLIFLFRVSDQVQHKPGCTATEDSLRREILVMEEESIYVAKTNVLIKLRGYRQLICSFVFANAKSSFSHDAAHKWMLMRISLSMGFK